MDGGGGVFFGEFVRVLLIWLAMEYSKVDHTLQGMGMGEGQEKGLFETGPTNSFLMTFMISVLAFDILLVSLLRLANLSFQFLF